MGEAVDNLVALSLAGEFPNLTAEDIDFIALAGKLDWSPKENWIDKAGGLPRFIEDMAIHMMENSGLSRSHAIAASVERTKVLAAKGNERAVAALAQWEKMKASTKTKAAAK